MKLNETDNDVFVRYLVPIALKFGVYNTSLLNRCCVITVFTS